MSDRAGGVAEESNEQEAAVGIRTPDDVLELLDAPVTAAAAGAALELGLFWLLEARPLPPPEVAGALAIPLRRCAMWLQLLERAGLLVATTAGYRPSAATHVAIIAAWSKETWALLAQEARERRDALADFPARLREPGRTGADAATYVSAMVDDPERARRFTHMLLELHGHLADQLAASLDLDAARRLLDLGGGSGVIAMALLRRFPGLQATIADIPNVCAASSEIAAEAGLLNRISFLPVDLLRDALPSGFDVVIECDVGLYGEALFRRIWAALLPGGRFLIVDQLRLDDDCPPPRLEWALEGSLRNPEYTASTVRGIVALLEASGFVGASHGSLRGWSGRSGASTIA